MARFAHVCLSQEPENFVTVLCDLFEVDDEGGINVYYNGDLWAYFSKVEYVTMVDEEIYDQLEDDEEDESEDDEDEEPSEPSGTVDLVVSEDVLSDLSLANGGVEVDADSR